MNFTRNYLAWRNRPALSSVRTLFRSHEIEETGEELLVEICDNSLEYASKRNGRMFCLFLAQLI